MACSYHQIFVGCLVLGLELKFCLAYVVDDLFLSSCPEKCLRTRRVRLKGFTESFLKSLYRVEAFRLCQEDRHEHIKASPRLRQVA